MNDSATVFRKMSLRRALWRARMAAKAIKDQTQLPPAERHATALLRSSVKQQLKSQPVDGFISGLYAVEDEWRAQVLRRDPQVLSVASGEELRDALADDAAGDVLVRRESGLSAHDLERLFPEGWTRKTVFVEF